MNCPYCKKPLTEKTTYKADGIIYCLGCGNEIVDTTPPKESEDLMDRGKKISMEDLDGVEYYDPITKTRRQFRWKKLSVDE